MYLPVYNTLFFHQNMLLYSIQTSPIDTDTEGVIESIQINMLSVLSGLNWEKL